MSAQSGKVRIIQTNAAGDNVHIIDPMEETPLSEVPHRQVVLAVPKRLGP